MHMYDVIGQLDIPGLALLRFNRLVKVVITSSQWGVMKLKSRHTTRQLASVQITSEVFNSPVVKIQKINNAVCDGNK